MINEERVKELYQMALYDQNENNAAKRTVEYYQNDYIWKELLKSFFSGAIAYALLLLLWGLTRAEDVMENSSLEELASSIVTVVLLYIAFMAVYLLITVIVYYVRFAKNCGKLKSYRVHLKKVNKMYEREDKLKV